MLLAAEERVGWKQPVEKEEDCSIEIQLVRLLVLLLLAGSTLTAVNTIAVCLKPNEKFAFCN